MVFLLPLALSLFSTSTSSRLMFLLLLLLCLFVCLFSNEFMGHYPDVFSSSHIEKTHSIHLCRVFGAAVLVFAFLMQTLK